MIKPDARARTMHHCAPFPGVWPPLPGKLKFAIAVPARQRRVTRYRDIFRKCILLHLILFRVRIFLRATRIKYNSHYSIYFEGNPSDSIRCNFVNARATFYNLDHPRRCRRCRRK